MVFSNTLSRLLRWLLRVDLPVPVRAEHELAAEAERNYKWNFAVNLLDGANFWFGASFISSSTILPLFVSKLTSDPLPLGLLAVIAQSGWFLPQLFTANAVGRLARKKPVVVNLGLFLERLPVWFMAWAALLALRWPAPALALFLFSYAWHGLGAGIVATSWQDLIANCFPVNRRGGFIGLTNFLGAGTGAAGAFLSTWLLKTFPFPQNFAYAFAIAASFIFLSWFFLALAREPVRPGKATASSNREFLSSLPGVVRTDHNFRRFLIARMLMALGGLGSGFVTVSAVQRFHVADSTVGVYTIIWLAGQTAGNLALGFVADRFGNKLALEIGTAASCLSFTLVWQAPAAEWYYVAFALSGLMSSTVMGAAILIVMEFCEPQRIPTYVGIGNTGVGLVGIVAPLIGAGLANVNYALLFAVSAGIQPLAFLLMRWWVREPRHVQRHAA